MLRRLISTIPCAFNNAKNLSSLNARVSFAKPHISFPLTITPQSFFSSSSSSSSSEVKNGNNTETESKPSTDKQQKTAEMSSSIPAEATKLLAEKDAKIRELNSAYLLCLADMENLRSRTKKEVEQASFFGIQKFAKDLLTVADIMELALESIPEAERMQPDNKLLTELYKGLELTFTELISVFKKHGLEPIDPLHHKFDPNIHMALFETHVEGAEPGKVISVQKKGYSLNNRLIRPASVGVSKAEKK